METRELICTSCPLGCRITVEMDEDKVIKISGNTCKRGETYALKECTNPTRIVTSSVKVSGGKHSVVSVKTTSDIPKNRIFDCIAAIKDIEVEAPIKIGDVILRNAANTGVDIIATKNIDAN